MKQQAGSRLPGIFAMLGALMLAASVSAFVAANWQEIPRTVRLAGILTLIAGCFVPALLLQRRGMPTGADAAVTLATLCYGAGISLVGQMYHLPGDWPAGAMLIAIGGLVAAALTGKNGPLIIAFVAMTSWSCGRFDAWMWREVHWAFLLLFVPGFLLALGRDNRLVAHTAVLALSVWLATCADAIRRQVPSSRWSMAASRSRRLTWRSGCWPWTGTGPPLIRAFVPWGCMDLRNPALP